MNIKNSDDYFNLLLSVKEGYKAKSMLDDLKNDLGIHGDYHAYFAIHPNEWMYKAFQYLDNISTSDFDNSMQDSIIQFLNWYHGEFGNKYELKVIDDATLAFSYKGNAVDDDSFYTEASLYLKQFRYFIEPQSKIYRKKETL